MVMFRVKIRGWFRIREQVCVRFSVSACVSVRVRVQGRIMLQVKLESVLGFDLVYV